MVRGGYRWSSLLSFTFGSACFGTWPWQPSGWVKVHPRSVQSHRDLIRTRAVDGTDTVPELQKLFHRALRFSDRGQTSRAIRAYKQLIRTFPECQEAWLNLGICRAGSDDDGALQAFEKALSLDPMYHEAHYNKALVLDDLGLVSDAVESFRQAEDSAGNDVASAAMYCCSSALLLASEQQYDEALSAYDRAINRDPNCVDAWTNRGELLCELGEFSEAISSHCRALELSKEPRLKCGILYNLAFTYAVMGEKSSCQETLDRAIALDKDEVLSILLNFRGASLSQRRQEEMAFLQLETADRGDRGDQLLTLVRKLRSLEEDPRWIFERVLDSATSSAATAYGTTWLESWWKLAQKADLYAHDAACMVVLGSSIGWQCFLGHLHLGYASCIGYEILTSQVADSRHLARTFGLEEHVTFHCKDAMMADVSEANLVWLNIYAWPIDVKQHLCDKLLKELTAETVVVSYEAIPDHFTDENQTTFLELQYVEEMETSWDPQLLGHVYRLKSMACLGLGANGWWDSSGSVDKCRY